MSSNLPPGLAEFDGLPDASHVNLHVVMSLTGMSKATVYRQIGEGRLPAPVKLTPGSSRWNVGALRAALRALQQPVAA